MSNDSAIASLPFIAVESSNMQGVHYDGHNEVLFVQFKTGKVYSYDGVPAGVAADLMLAESKGKFFNANIKNEYDFLLLN